MQRREFLAAAGGAMLAQAQTPQFVKSICGVIFPGDMPIAERFQKAKNAGFDGMELRLGGELNLDSPAARLKEIADAARASKVAIVTMWVSDPLSKNPLNHTDPAVRAQGVDAIDKAIDIAKELECGALLIVPGRLGDGPRFRYGYQDTWERISGEMGKLIPHAEKAQVCLTPENVWNKFLVSPLEMRAFVDQFHSPWLQSHFDIGNVMQFGYPQDWILTLGPRIKRIHVKDYKLSARAEQGRFVDLLEGDVDWKEVMAALKKIGYRGFMSPEIGQKADDPDQLMKVSRALDKILAM